MSFVLFADDHAEMRHLVRDVLEAVGHEVQLVSDGAAVLDAVERREPELLILDLQMPEMSGLEVCRRLKANPFTARIPVLMLTAQGAVDDKVQGFEAGADDYLPKPFDARELRARAEALVRLVQREAERNPTTGLPGGKAIELEIERRVRRGNEFAVCYIDLDNFKAFADSFGFAEADRVIRETGRALQRAIREAGAEDDFCGHIGGDDFIIVTDAEAAPSIARASALAFRDAMTSVVGSEVVEKGEFRGLDRSGAQRDFPIATLSAVVLRVDPEHWVSPSHLGSLAADAKRRAKNAGGGTIEYAEV